MLVLDTTTRTLEIDLNAAVTANQLPVVVTYADHVPATPSYTAALQRSITNNTTAVTILSAPAASTQRVVKSINIKNNDTAAVLLWVQLNDNATLAELVKQTLAVQDTLQYTDTEGWSVLDTNGQKKSLASISGTVAVTQSGTWDEVGINDSGNSITVDQATGTNLHTVLDSGTLTTLTTITNVVHVDDNAATLSIDDGAGSITVDNATISVVGSGTEATAQRVTIATDSTGVLSVDDNGGSLTVDGTVTANAGTNLNTSALALDATVLAGNVLEGAVNETAPATDTASSGLNGRLQRVAQRLTSLIALLPTALGSAAASASLAVTQSTEDVARAGIITETAPATDTASSGLNGRLQRIAQRLTSLIALFPSALVSGRLDVNLGAAPATVTIAAIPAGTNNIGDVDVLTLPALAAGTNNIGDVDVLTLPNVTLAAGTNTNEVVGDVAHDSAVGGNPVLIGLEARTTDGTPVTSGDAVRGLGDTLGKQVVLVGAVHDRVTSGTLNRVNTTAADVIAAAGAGVRIAVNAVLVTNAHATVNTKVTIRDGTTAKIIGYAPAVGGGFSHKGGGTPLFISTANTAVTAICGTTGADVDINISGYLIAN